MIEVKDLADVTLLQVDAHSLSRAKLAKKKLIRADLRMAALQFSDLSGADLAGASLSAANLTGANLQDADLRNASLTDAILKDVDLTCANLSGASLGGDSDLSGIHFGSTTKLQGATFRRAQLRMSVFDHVDLAGCDFRGADLRGVRFHGGKVNAALFKEANMEGCIFSMCDLTDVDFCGVNLSKTIFENVKIKHARWDRHTVWPDGSFLPYRAGFRSGKFAGFTAAFLWLSAVVWWFDIDTSFSSVAFILGTGFTLGTVAYIEFAKRYGQVRWLEMP